MSIYLYIVYREITFYRMASYKSCFFFGYSAYLNISRVHKEKHTVKTMHSDYAIM